MEKLDIERLHEVALGRLDGRGCGKSTLISCEIIGLSRLPSYNGKAVFIMAERAERAENAFKNLIEVCKSMCEKYEIIDRASIKINSMTVIWTRN